MANNIPDRNLFGDIPHEVYEYFRNLGVNLDTKEDSPPDLSSALIAALSDTVSRLENAIDMSEMLSANVIELKKQIEEINDNEQPDLGFLFGVKNMTVITSEYSGNIAGGTSTVNVTIDEILGNGDVSVEVRTAGVTTDLDSLQVTSSITDSTTVTLRRGATTGLISYVLKVRDYRNG